MAGKKRRASSKKTAKKKAIRQKGSKKMGKKRRQFKKSAKRKQIVKNQDDGYETFESDQEAGEKAIMRTPIKAGKKLRRSKKVTTKQRPSSPKSSQTSSSTSASSSTSSATKSKALLFLRNLLSGSFLWRSSGQPSFEEPTIAIAPSDYIHIYQASLAKKGRKSLAQQKKMQKRANCCPKTESKKNLHSQSDFNHVYRASNVGGKKNGPKKASKKGRKSKKAHLIMPQLVPEYMDIYLAAKAAVTAKRGAKQRKIITRNRGGIKLNSHRRSLTVDIAPSDYHHIFAGKLWHDQEEDARDEQSSSPSQLNSPPEFVQTISDLVDKKSSRISSQALQHAISISDCQSRNLSYKRPLKPRQKQLKRVPKN